MRAAELGRGAVLGVVFSAFGGAASLLVMNLFYPVRCEGLSETECAFEHQVHREDTARHRLMAAGLAVLGTGALLWLRTLSQDKRT
jgi:hypothetical protein